MNFDFMGMLKLHIGELEKLILSDLFLQLKLLFPRKNHRELRQLSLITQHLELK